MSKDKKPDTFLNPETSSVKAGRKPKELDDLEQCFELVKSGQLLTKYA